MKTLLLVPAILLCILSSCKKDSKTNTNCDKTVVAIAGTYSVVKVEAGISGVYQDISNQLATCELDDRLNLNTNGTSEYQDEGTICNPSGNSTGTGSISTTGKMTIDDNGSSTDISIADITSFDCSTLVLSGTESGGSGLQYRLTLKK